MKNIMKSFAIVLIVSFALTGLAQETPFSLEVVAMHEGPVIDQGDPGTHDNKYGFEGGRAFKYKGNYHLFTAERFGDPKIVKMRLGHWKSSNGADWQRVSTLFESSGNFTGEDKYASFWSPMPFFNEKENRWNMFYVAYRSKPNDSTGWYLNHDGRIVRAVSQTPGYKGLDGPYRNDKVVLKPGPNDGEWEGLQGTDSFYPFEVDGQWYGFYGSAQTQSNINEKYPKWTLALARAPEMAGPWEKWTEHGHVEFHERFAENPVITKLDNGYYVAVLDGGGPNRIGYSFSEDGMHWEEATFLPLAGHTKKWWTNLRTPLGLIPEGNGRYTVFFTAYTKSEFAKVGKVTLKMVKE
jgi:hypothetical protein